MQSTRDVPRSDEAPAARPKDTTAPPAASSTEEARQVAEQARETEWAGRGFLRELFLGNFLLELIHPFPRAARSGPEFAALLRRAGDVPARGGRPGRDRRDRRVSAERASTGLRKLGAFGMKIPKEYGGLGFTVSEYCTRDGDGRQLRRQHQRAALRAPVDRRAAAAQALRHPEQKKKYLPRCAAGAISAFALTEPHVGSDPASLVDDGRAATGDDFVLNGEKLWCTNGTLAELLVVMARDPKTKKISALHRRDRLAGRQGRAPLPLHGPEGARQRRDQLPATCACRART